MTLQEFENNIKQLLKDDNYKEIIKIYKKHSKGNRQQFVTQVYYSLIKPLSEAENCYGTINKINEWLDTPLEETELTRSSALTLILFNILK